MFGFLHEREKKLSLSIYLKNRLYNYRGNFRKNITYLLHSAVAVDLSHLKSEIRINMRIRKNARTVTAGVLETVHTMIHYYKIHTYL